MVWLVALALTSPKLLSAAKDTCAQEEACTASAGARLGRPSKPGACDSPTLCDIQQRNHCPPTLNTDWVQLSAIQHTPLAAFASQGHRGAPNGSRTTLFGRH